MTADMTTDYVVGALGGQLITLAELSAAGDRSSFVAPLDLAAGLRRELADRNLALDDVEFHVGAAVLTPVQALAVIRADGAGSGEIIELCVSFAHALVESSGLVVVETMAQRLWRNDQTSYGKNEVTS